LEGRGLDCAFIILLAVTPRLPLLDPLPENDATAVEAVFARGLDFIFIFMVLRIVV
jgi:hypothetical protein